MHAMALLFRSPRFGVGRTIILAALLEMHAILVRIVTDNVLKTQVEQMRNLILILFSTYF